MSVGLALCPAILVLLGRNWTEWAKRPIKVQVLQEFLSKTCFGVGTPQSFTKNTTKKSSYKTPSNEAHTILAPIEDGSSIFQKRSSDGSSN